jgi:hypothetical protein
MRRSLVVITFLAVLGSLVLGPWAANADALASGGPPQADTCVLTSYTLTGSFSRLGGATTFTLDFGGGCLGTSSSVVGNVTFSSVGPWSCVAGVGLGAGAFQPSNGVPEFVAASVVNVGGEYVIEMHTPALTAAAVGNIVTLPIACVDGQVQTTIGGFGTLTFGATS